MTDILLDISTGPTDMPTFVQALKDGFAAEAARIREAHFGGATGASVVKANTALMDRVVSLVFERAASEAGLSPGDPGWALAAIGGYGRGELNPHSDVDLMFIGPDKAGGGETVKEFPTRVLHILWDLGLDIGYSVRRVEDCVKLIKQDSTIMTSLIESRRLCGAEGGYAKFVSAMEEARRPRLVDSFIREKLNERARRHKKFGDSVFLREPNIKEGAGGLRDIHTALWISTIKGRNGGIDGLVEAGVLNEADGKRLKGAKDRLLRLRNELHYLAGHRQDVLTFDLQEKAAQDFGYVAKGSRLAVESFMRAYYIRARGVWDITHAVIERSLEKDTGWRWRVFSPTKKRLDDSFYVVGGTLCVDGDAPALFRERPELMTAAFSHGQSQGFPMSDKLKTAITGSVMALGKRGRESKEAGRAFLEILGRPFKVHETLERMHSMRLLGRVLPEIGAVSALVEHDLYHKYTVDEHSLLAVKRLQGLFSEEGMTYPELREAMNRVKDRQILFLAALLHDTGKASGHGHAEQGARLAVKAAKRLGMDDKRASAVEFLVRNHLLMAHIAQRRELSDRKVIEKFCGIVADRELLDMLYLLTYADMASVGPDVFNDWRRRLIKELYDSASAYLMDERSVVAYEKERAAKFTDALVAAVGAVGGGRPADVRKFLAKLPKDYTFSVPVETAVRHFGLTRGLKPSDVVIDRQHDSRGHTDLTIILHDVMGLLYMSAGALAAKNMNILSAQIFTCKDGVIVDTLQVTDCNKQPALDEGIWRDIDKGLKDVLTGRVKVEDMMPSRPAYPRRVALRETPPRVEFDNEASDRYTVVEVYAQDRVGLLYDITRTMYDCGVYISSAKVDTEVDQVVDIFYVTDIFRQKIETPERMTALRERLVGALTGEG